MLKMARKWPRPSVEATNDVARPMKRIKKRAKNGEREIFVISSHETRTSTPDTPCSTFGGEVPTRTLQNSSASNIDQMTTI